MFDVATSATSAGTTKAKRAAEWESTSTVRASAATRKRPILAW